MKNLLLIILLFSIVTHTYAQAFSDVSLSSGINFSREQLFIIGGGVCVIDYNNDGLEAKLNSTDSLKSI